MSETAKRDNGNKPIRDDPIFHIRDAAGDDEDQAHQPKEICEEKRTHFRVLDCALVWLEPFETHSPAPLSAWRVSSLNQNFIR
jgi:hypothetical protein